MRIAPSVIATRDSETRELREQVRELEEALTAIRAGQVDAVVVPGGLATSGAAAAAAGRLRDEALDHMRDAVFAFDRAEHVVYMNPAAEQQYGWMSAEALGWPRSAIYEERPDPSGFQAAGPGTAAHIHVLRDGRAVHVESSVSPLLDAAGVPIGTVAVVRDVSERRRADARRDALAKLGECLRNAERVHEIGSAARRALSSGLGPRRFADLWFGEVAGLAADDGPARQDGRPAVQLQQQPGRVPGPAAGPATRAMLPADVPGIWLTDEMDFARDVAERERAAMDRVAALNALRDSEARLRQANEELEDAVRRRTGELMAAEEALRQAQKMEAVGQLTGGIAHDFNNLLASISGALQVLRAKLAQGRPEGCERYVDMGLESTGRAAALTQRLLAFARRQTLDPKPTDVNRLVDGMEDLVRRTVGDVVEVQVVGAEPLWTTRIDPPQLENALLNLCINARDAMMPAGGRLTIRTANRSVDGPAESEHGLVPGDYVVVSVSDSGTGMTAELIDRIFDPFFTTKPMGQGTGLGLSMVYGFVRQSGGQVRVASTVGEGTTLSLYLPRHLGEAAAEVPPSAQEPAGESGRGETVLLIEDHETIRVVISEVLEDAGYRVLMASDGPAGLRVLQAPGRIDLLVTDVGLPGGLNGRQVADAARVGRPGLKVLFITGYADNAAVGTRNLDSGMEILAKPFDIDALTRRVRTMLG